MKLMNSLYEFDNEVGSILDGYSLYKSNIPLLAPQEVVIGHGIGGKHIPIMARLAKGQTLE
jgi:hypothetical protein